jgi:hypothetical protein
VGIGIAESIIETTFGFNIDAVKSLGVIHGIPLQQFGAAKVCLPENQLSVLN